MARKKTTIVCTMGPATESDEVLRELILAGMNVARFNFSHGSHEYHRTMIGRVRSISDELGIPIAIMLDTKGPEVRTGLLEDGKKVTLTTGESVIVTTDDDVIGNAQRFSLDYKNLPKEVKKGSIILIDDGLIGLEVDHVEGTDMHCKIINGGELGEKKGVNVPNVNIGLPSVTEQDRADIMFGCELGIDAIAASFIRDGAAVEEIRNICREMGTPNVQIFPKIESALGVKNFDEILAASNGIMVARGDLGVEVPAAEVPHIQKTVIKKCNDAYKPVITATQMLDSMIRNPRPTRAEVTDVANAIYDGTDCVMLSGESAAGKYPVEAVKRPRSTCQSRMSITSVRALRTSTALLALLQLIWQSVLTQSASSAQHTLAVPLALFLTSVQSVLCMQCLHPMRQFVALASIGASMHSRPLSRAHFLTPCTTL